MTATGAQTATPECSTPGQDGGGDVARAVLAVQATGWVKPLVMPAGGIISGDREANVDCIMTHGSP